MASRKRERKKEKTAQTDQPNTLTSNILLSKMCSEHNLPKKKNCWSSKSRQNLQWHIF